MRIDLKHPADAHLQAPAQARQAVSAKSLNDYMLENLRRYRAEYYNFGRIFGVNLRDYYEDHIYGFDVVKFDDEFVKSGDEAMSAKVLRDYGEEGVNVILRLLGSEEK